MMNIEHITSEERELLDAMILEWGKHLSKNKMLSAHYNGKVGVDDLGVAMPPEIASMLNKCALMWSKQAVNRIADGSVIDGFQFVGEEPAGFTEMMERNEIRDQYDETLPSQLTHGPSFWTVSAGDTTEPPAIISAYDAEHATALYDYRARTTKCGLAIIDVDPKDRHRPTAINFYAPNGDIIEAERSIGATDRWVYNRISNPIGRCAMEVMRFDPDRNHPFGKPALTQAILSHEDEANREFNRMVMHAELFTSPTRYLLGVDEDYFDGAEWTAYLGTIFAASTGDPANPPTTGQYPQADMTPHIAYIRQLANQLAAEASIPIHSLLYTEANPASAEAIEASRNDLVEKVCKLNRQNGHALRNIGLMALAIMEEKPVNELGPVERSLSVKWKNPLHPSLAASADAAQKTAATVPGFAGTTAYWRMLGYDDTAIAEIRAELDAKDDAEEAPEDGEAL